MISLATERAPALRLESTTRAEFLAVIPFMRALARCLCAEAQDADALALESLKQALSRRDEHVASTSLKHWCFAIELEVLQSRSLKPTASRASKRRPLDTIGRTLRWWAPIGDVDLPDALSDLAFETRAAVALVDGAGCTVEEAAAICRSTPHAVDRDLNEGRRRLDRVMSSGGAS